MFLRKTCAYSEQSCIMMQGSVAWYQKILTILIFLLYLHPPYEYSYNEGFPSSDSSPPLITPHCPLNKVASIDNDQMLIFFVCSIIFNPVIPIFHCPSPLIMSDRASILQYLLFLFCSPIHNLLQCGSSHMVMFRCRIVGANEVMNDWIGREML